MRRTALTLFSGGFISHVERIRPAPYRSTALESTDLSASGIGLLKSMSQDVDPAIVDRLLGGTRPQL
jgi:hypothetical protein